MPPSRSLPRALPRLCLTAAALALWPGLAGPVRATGECASDAMIVFDGSASMDEIGFDTGEATRIVEARAALRRAMPDIAPYRRVGLLIYGPGPDDACSNIDLRFGPVTESAGPVVAAIDGLRPGGMTPLSEAVARAAEILNWRRDPAVVVLVTDGNETCGGAPCALADRLERDGRDLTVHVVGFRVRVDFFTWNNPEQAPMAGGETVVRCLADRTGGRFVTTETVDELVAALQATLGCPVIGQAPAALPGRG